MQRIDASKDVMEKQSGVVILNSLLDVYSDRAK